MTRYKVLVDYHQMYLSPMGHDPIIETHERDPLLDVVDGGTSLILFTGISIGPVWLTLTGPESAPAGEWEERQDVVMEIREPLYLIAANGTDPPTWDPSFTPSAPGPHTVTVFARGRGVQPDAGLDPSEEPTDEFWVVISPTG